LLQTIANAAADKKAENIVLLDVRGLASFTDFLVIGEGTSDRQVRSMGEHIEAKVAEAKGPRTIGREGYEQGEWVLVDFGEVVVHLFTEDERRAFDLENLWGDAPRLRWDPKNPPTELFNVHKLRRETVQVGAAPARKRKAH
jgi:ribosome-associated protein